MQLTKKLSFWTGPAIAIVVSGLACWGIASIGSDAHPAQQPSTCVEQAFVLSPSTRYVACPAGQFIDFAELDEETWLVCRCTLPSPAIQVFPGVRQQEAAPEPNKKHTPIKL